MTSSIRRFFVLNCAPGPTETPSIGARVHVAGRTEPYYVLRVDPDRCLADLVPENGMHLVEENVPFSQIHVDAPPHGQVTYLRLRRRAADEETELLAG